MNDFLFQPIDKFVKLSKFNLSLIKKCCSGSRVVDLLLHLPVSLCRRIGDLEKISEKDKLTVVLKIMDHAIPRGGSFPYKVMGQTPAGELITVLYFNYNVHFIRKALPIGGNFTVSGNVQANADGIQIIHPDVIASPAAIKYHLGPEPVYPLVAKLSNRVLLYVMGSLLRILPTISDWIPQELIEKHRLMSFGDAIGAAHRPKTMEDLSEAAPARRRIAIDELLANQIRLRQMRSRLSSLKMPIFRSTGVISDELKLPFELTADQRRCLEDIKRDFESGKPMNRLIQGDVGSGKTVLALMSMLIALENGAQSALLAPTEILALQHLQTIHEFFDNLGLNADLMLGGNRRMRPRQIEKIKNGETQILVGTHAILESNVEFKNLGLIVIDEQHKFGVLQRLSLIEKSQCPHVLAMSATPIPRTLLLGCYGDLDVSTIHTKPAGRRPIETVVLNASKINDLIPRLKETDSQIYWVCPVIGESETMIDINTRCEYLSSAFSKENVRILHGKMKPMEKNDIIRQFKDGAFKLLVSTTVIEVGIDIPNANIIVIEHAERYGLAQLHQLRGRVGRGREFSYCVLLYHYPISKIGRQRLQLLRDIGDGFLLSEEDLKLRGAGDILGKEQSGFSTLRFSDFAANGELIQIAKEMAESVDINAPLTACLCDIFGRLNFANVCN
ncbi:MAG: ATP-dependent DNA helicase RecG [Holosporaceae bacterium]|jgi:ATP-dependent DNA helicase RecG|nr:ATP-dependent DNA helicase RecG [Holosporaceae bacterium]